MIEIAGIVSTVFAVAAVVLNNRRLRFCFVLWLVSNSVSLWKFEEFELEKVE